jgi:hypothetical protein
MWYSYTMEFYSGTKKNEILSFAGKLTSSMKLTRFKRPKVQKPGSKATCFLSYVEHSPNTNTTIL